MIFLQKLRGLTGPALLLLAALLACAPLFFYGASCGHDFDFHLVSWLDVQSAWRHGLLYPHWSPSSNFGAGEPRFVFYPPLTWMLGALLGFALPWTLVPAALTFLLLAGTGLATRALARQALSEAPSTMTGILAIFSGYALFTAYERTAYGELAGGICIPLLLLLALRHRDLKGHGFSRAIDAARTTWALAPEVRSSPSHVLRQIFDGSAAPLAWILAAAWLANAPLGVMASYLLAFVALIAALASRSWVPLLRAALATALGLGLAAFYLVPAAWEQRWVDIRQATGDPGERIENSFIFARHRDVLLAFHDEVLLRVSLIGAAMLAAALAGIFLAWKRKRLTHHAWWLPLALIPALVLLLQLPLSLPLWNLLPKLRFLQFPWRWLVTLEAPMALFVATALWPDKNAPPWRRWALGALGAVFCIASTVYAGHAFYQVCDEQDNVASMVGVYRSGAGFQGTDEYAPQGADQTMMASGLPAACLATAPDTVLSVAPPASGDAISTPIWNADQHSCEAVAADWAGTPEHRRLTTVLPHAGFLILRLRSYPAWLIRINGQKVDKMIARPDGLMALPAPQGAVDLSIDWSSPPDVWIGRALSLTAVLLLTVLWFFERRSSRTQVS
jgi:hypothetical protein